MKQTWQGAGSGERSDRVDGGGGAIGKRTLVVQRYGGGRRRQAADDGERIQVAAATGLAGPGQSLPHAEAIQRSFGPAHDVSAIRAHVGGAASDAAAAIGAEAYASGGEVAFGAAPDLHVAAHEAAHVIQQRAGVQLYGGVGEDGDRHERHADAVADRVAAGQPADNLLAFFIGGGGGGAAVQRKSSKAEAKQHFEAGEEGYAKAKAEADEKQQAGDYLAAAAEYLAAFKLATGDAKAPLAYDIAQCHRHAGRHADAARWYRTALELGGAKIAPLRDDIETQLAAMNAQAKTDPDHSAVAHGADDLGVARDAFTQAEQEYAAGAYGAALQHYQAALALAPGEPALYFDIGQCYRRTNQLLDARSAYAKYLELAPAGPDAPIVRELMQDLDNQLGADIAGAGDPATVPKDLGPARAMYDQAETFYKAKEYARAVPLYREAYERSSKPELIFNLAQACRLAGQLPAAGYWYREYLRKVPSTPLRADVEARLAEVAAADPNVAAAGPATADAPAGANGATKPGAPTD